MNAETRFCQVGRCERSDATRCGTVYACPPCREQIARLAEQAGARR